MREAPFFHDFCIVTSKNMKTNNKNGREASENFENGVFSSLHFYYHRFKFTTTDFSPKTATTIDLYYHRFKTLNHTLVVINGHCYLYVITNNEVPNRWRLISRSRWPNAISRYNFLWSLRFSITWHS